MERAFSANVGPNTIELLTGKLAGQAGGAVVVRSGDTMLLATATASDKPREGVDFFPLSVDYEERLYAAGKIPGGFFKREGRPSEAAILLCRLTDRPLRPLFPKGLRNDVQVIITALSSDQEQYLDILSIIGASAALSISNIPWLGPVGAVRVGYVNGEFVFNPTASEMEKSLMDLRLAGTADAILMVEAGANVVSEELILEGMKRGHEAMQDIIKLQVRMQEEIGKPKFEFRPAELSEGVRQKVVNAVGARVVDALTSAVTKEERYATLDEIEEELVAGFEGNEEEPVVEGDIREAFSEIVRQQVRSKILEGIRPDGRGLTDIRPISCEVGLLPRAHGSGLFTRGETQALSIVTLGTASDEQMLDGLGVESSKRYMHHYNFPPYSTGETRPVRGPGRREIGHGALAERALVPVIPSEEVFPYTIRVVSEIMSSNGSTSMASVCGSTLALMDAGVPIKMPVAGAAMGLVIEGDRHAILTDIQGMEDHLGDMDFKVAGTAEGITALQMDIKVKGVTHEILREALEQARAARLFILDKMLQAIDKPRPDLSPYAPRIIMIKIDPEKIGTVIGPGGKMIRSIIEQTGVKIDVEDDGSVFIAGTDGEGSKKAVELIRGLTEEAEIGKIYTGKVVRTTDFGAFVEILPGKDGLVHISQLADYRVPSVEDVVRVGDEIMVMVIGIDETGKIKLSRQAVLEGWTAEQARERDRVPSRGGGGRPPRGSGESRGDRDKDRDRDRGRRPGPRR
jgi:polyribonucleotide nucleotidyltransferase